MNLDKKFQALEIEPTTSNKRRLSGVLRPIIPVLNEQGDTNSSSDSSVQEELDEQYNENNPAQNNIIEHSNNSSVPLRRSGRKRGSPSTYISPFMSGGYTNSTSKFAKLATNPKLQQIADETPSETDDPTEYLKKIYLDKTVKLKCNALETIFEEPKVVGRGKGKAAIMSGRKYRRKISFDETISNITKKTKKRGMKAKTITSMTRSRSKFNLKNSDLSL